MRANDVPGASQVFVDPAWIAVVGNSQGASTIYLGSEDGNYLEPIMSTDGDPYLVALSVGGPVTMLYFGESSTMFAVPLPIGAIGNPITYKWPSADTTISCISAGADGEFWAVGSDNSVWRFNPLTNEPEAQSVELTMIAVVDANLQFGVDSGNMFWQRSGGAWISIGLGPPDGTISSLGATAGGFAYVVTSTGTPYLYTETADLWVPIGGGDLSIQQMSIMDGDHAWAIGADGSVIDIGDSTATTRPNDVLLPRRGLLWDTESVFDETKSTHLYLVNRAAQLASSIGGDLGAWITDNLTPYVSPPQAGAFRTNLCQGLYDADFLPAYNNPRIGMPTYKSHFYDHDTGMNYLDEAEPTAVTNGSNFFNASVSAMVAGNTNEAAYNLGLALHYFTDLTQPMHSANYTYLSSFPLGYHTDFELFAMAQQALLNPQPIVIGFVPDPAPASIATLYQLTASHFKTDYFNTINQAHKYLAWKLSPGQWQADVLDLLPHIFQDAVQAAAQLIWNWATLTLPPPAAEDASTGA